MKKILSLAFVFSMVVAFAGAFTSTASATPARTNFNIDGHVAICHALGNGGYNSISPDVNGVLNGHAGHSNDIIPPFLYGENNSQSFAGLNWTADGQLIYNNNCVAPQDVCTNIAGIQVSLPQGDEFASAGICIPIPTPTTTTVNATKIICPTEGLLPNWGDHATTTSITSTTATDFITAHPTCHIVPWTFEWAPSGTANPGDNVSVGGGAWTAFTGGTTVIPTPSTPPYVWVREQTNPVYIPFSGDVTNNTDNVSAEIYCNIDVLHYDNYERIDDMVAGHSYNCVAFNVLKDTGGPSCEPTSGTAVSDATTTVGGNPSALLTFIHPAWTASILDAKWIWSTNPVVEPTNSGTDLTKVFTKTFTITGTPTSGTLDIAVDNNYTVKVNNTTVPVTFSQNNFQLGTQGSYNIGSLLHTGVNTLEVTATNWESVDQSPDAASNPAGVLFKVTWASDCGDVPPPPTQCTGGKVPGPQNTCVCPQGETDNGGICVGNPIITTCLTPGADNFDQLGECVFTNHADLSITKIVDNNSPKMEDTVKYTLTVHNSGPNDATGVVVTDFLPVGEAFVSDVASQGTYSAPTWTVGTITNGSSATLTITVTVGNVVGQITNTATVTSAVNDPTPGNNSGSANLTVSDGPNISTDVCPNIDGNQATLPAGTHIDDQGNCAPNGGGGGGGSSGPTFHASGSGGPNGKVLGAETTVCNWDIKTYMRKGHKNDSAQVKILQKDLLNGYMHLKVAVNGIYDKATEDGVKAFQLAHKDKILTPWNLTVPTGIFFRTTLVEAKNSICPDRIIPIPSPLIPWSQSSSLVPATN